MKLNKIITTSFLLLGVFSIFAFNKKSYPHHLNPDMSQIKGRGDLYHTNLSNLYLSWSAFVRANLENSDLRNSNFNNSNFKWANFKRANLSGTNLTNTFLLGADFQDANLTNAKLDGAVLWDSNFSGANLTDISAKKIIGCPSYLPKGWICENNTLKKF